MMKEEHTDTQRVVSSLRTAGWTLLSYKCHWMFRKSQFSPFFHQSPAPTETADSDCSTYQISKWQKNKMYLRIFTIHYGYNVFGPINPV